MLRYMSDLVSSSQESAAEFANGNGSPVLPRFRYAYVRGSKRARDEEEKENGESSKRSRRA